MDYILAAALLVTAILLCTKRQIKIEITHKHVVESDEVRVVDPNKTDQMDPEIERSINGVIQSINEIFNGGETVGGKE